VQALTDVVLGWFTGDGWTLSESGDGSTWASTVEGENGRWMTVIRVDDDRRVFVFYSLLPVSPSASRIGDVVEYATRANRGMVTGNFEVDVDTGEVRYKTAIDLGEVALDDLASGTVTRALVADLVYTNVGTADRYLPGLLQVVAGAATPAGAIDAIEQPGGAS
jgi:hypothetical protein